MINTKCPVCHHTVDVIKQPSLFKLRDEYDHSYEIVACSKCNTVFTWFDTDITINQYYDELDYSLQDTRKTIFHTIQEIEYNRVLQKVSKEENGSQKKLLDFGCGKGVFLSFAKEKRFYVKGVETSLPRAGFAEKYFHIQVNTDIYTSGQIFPDKFDVLTLFHVIEHLSDPQVLLNNLVKDNLEKAGILVIEAPNFNSWQSKWAESRWMQLDVPRHIIHFTPDSLRKLVESCGCRIINQQYFSFHLGIMGMAQTMMNWFGYKGFLMSDLKHKRSWRLLLVLLMVLPFATITELLAALAGKGGLIRYYAIYNG